MSVRSSFIGFAGLVLLFGFTTKVVAAYPALTFRHDHHLFFVDPNRHTEWQSLTEKWMYHGELIKPPPAFRVDGDDALVLPDGYEKKEYIDWNREAIETVLQSTIADVFNREAGEVTIEQQEDGSVIFEGIGLPGRYIDMSKTIDLTIQALEQGVSDIVLPIIEIQPVLHIDKKLRDRGIVEVITVGESDFSGSPSARRHNIAVGLSKFNGHIVPHGETFSFNEVLGPVNASTGYKKELVILGERTLPDFGGGLCQVSTTAYRGIWEYGFPIDTRRNHSYSVRYYGPQGTDATIYPPYSDMRFTNDSPGEILLQTHVDEDDAYFIYYGTRDNRIAEIVGPYTWDHKAAPPPRTEYTTDIAPGTERVVGQAVAGLWAAWYRVTQDPDDNEEEAEGFYSVYEARPLFTQIGVAELPPEEIAEDIVEEVFYEPIIEKEPIKLVPSRRRRSLWR